MGQVPHAVRRPPCRAAASRQNSRKCAKPACCHLFAYPAFPVISTFPIRFPRFPTQAISPHATADPPYHTQASKTWLQSRRDQRPAPQIPRQSGSRIFPGPVYPVSTHPQPTSPHKSCIHTSPTGKSTSAPALPWRASQPAETSGWLTQTYAFYQLTQIPCADEGDMASATALRRHRSGGLHSSPPEGWLLRRGSPGNRGRLNPAKVRRCGAGSRRPSARPGVTHALRRWGTVSLLSQVSLAASR